MTPLLLGAALLLGPPAPVAVAAPSYALEVLPILTRQGCNQGGCHGKGAGQNGFRLSLRGYAPEQDHDSIVREFEGRRVDLAAPDESLLLQKAVGKVPHEGGAVFPKSGREYDTLRAWIAAGCPESSAKEAKLVKLSISPESKTLAAGESVPLTVTAHLSDGTARDVTWLALLDSNDAAVAGLTAGAVATARSPGVTAVRAAYLTEVAVATLTVPYPHRVDAAQFAAGTHPIDRAVFGQLAALRLPPSRAATDAEFLRRVALDCVGRLPTESEASAFLADNSPGKREALIDRLLAAPEFADHWALFLADLFQNRRERDHDVRGVKGVRQFHAWLREQVAANRPWDELARAVLLAQGDDDASPAVGYYVVTVGEAHEAEKSEAGEAVAQALLGTRIGCAKCHNHPLERYTQDDFYHWAAFFSKIKLDRKESKDGPTQLTVGSRDEHRAKKAPEAHQPRTGKWLKPQALDRKPTSIGPSADPRAALADWITNPANEAFAGAMANRIWKHYLGAGVVEPVDDLRATNPPSNPALWKTLTAEFVRGKYDLRKLMRFILTSRTYQLASDTRPENAADARFYSHYQARRLPAEVFLDAVCDATGSPEAFHGYVLGTRAVQLPDPGVKSPFLSLFGRPERTTACACERAPDVTLSQLLHLQNGGALAEKCAGGPLAAQLAAEPDLRKALDRVTMRALVRPATDAEFAAVTRLIAVGQSRKEVLADFVWAVLTSKDFAFNH